jgi:hypothetical protein
LQLNDEVWISAKFSSSLHFEKNSYVQFFCIPSWFNSTQNVSLFMPLLVFEGHVFFWTGWRAWLNQTVSSLLLYFCLSGWEELLKNCQIFSESLCQTCREDFPVNCSVLDSQSMLYTEAVCQCIVIPVVTRLRHKS